MSLGQRKPSRAEKEALERSDELVKEQRNLLRQQDQEKRELAKQAGKERTALLRGRFGLSGGLSADNVSDNSLYSRITGR